MTNQTNQPTHPGPSYPSTSSQLAISPTDRSTVRSLSGSSHHSSAHAYDPSKQHQPPGQDNHQFNGQYISHLPSSYPSQGSSHPVPIDPTLLPSHGHLAPGSNPSVMVYPPPPPMPQSQSRNISHTGHPSGSISPLFASHTGSANQQHAQLPPPGTWNPHSQPSPNYYTQPSHPGPSQSSMPFAAGPNGNSSAHDGTGRPVKRRPSDAEEVEAGLALANMAEQAKKTSPKLSSGTGSKKAKKDENKKSEKDNRKSCSECRRLKAKCDRVFPCSNCRRRGCALVCPDGDLSCMQGKRLVLASTEQLHERIAQLEAALSQSHSKMNLPQHPLLAPQYLDGGFVNAPPFTGDEALQAIKTSPSPPLAPNKSVDGLSPKGLSSDTSFTLLTPRVSIERSSTADRMAVGSLLLDADKAAAEGKREDEWVGENAAPAMILGNCVGSNGSSDADDHRKIVDRLRKILLLLPPREEARKRADSFWYNSTWYNSMLKQEEYENVYEPAVYAPTPTNPLSPHKLACVLMVLTLDTYFDLTGEEDNPAIATYWDGAQQCFDTRFGWAASVAGVQALALAALFVNFGWRGAKASNLYWLRMMTSAAQQLGLHKDPHTSLPEDERDFRRRVFWDCYAIDCLMSINHGQRTAIPLENVETAMPIRSASRVCKLKYEYMRTIKTSVIDIGCRPDSAPASWEQIAQTHEILMTYDLKPFPGLHSPILTDQVTPPKAEDPNHMDVLAMSRCTLSMCHYKALMFLYRPSLRRLIARLKSQPRDQVVLSEADRQTISMSYIASHAIAQTSLYMSRTHPRLSARCWSVWVQTFSAAVSMTALALWCGPHLEPSFIPSTFAELAEACDMIRENGSKRSQSVLSLLPVLQALIQHRYPHIVGNPPASANITNEAEDMLFALLGGQVDQRVVAPQQGNLMNPPVVPPPQQSPNTAAPTIKTQDLSSRQPTHSPVDTRAPGSQQPPSAQSIKQEPQVPSQHQAPSISYTPTHPSFPPTMSTGSSGYNTSASTPVWANPVMALPLVTAQPSANPMEGYHSQLPYTSQQHQPHHQHPQHHQHHQHQHQHSHPTHQHPHQPRLHAAQQGLPPPMAQHTQQRSGESHQPPSDPNTMGGAAFGDLMGGLENSDLWARLQTFYEPTPSYWGQSVVGVPTAYMDYAGMAGMGMGM